MATRTAGLDVPGVRRAGQEPGFARMSPGFSPVMLIPDPARPAPGPFRLFSTGCALLCFLQDAAGFCLSSPDGLSDEHKWLVSTFFDDLRDWISTSGDLKSIQAGQCVSVALSEQIKGLAEAGFAIGARERFLLLTGGADAEPSSWRITDIEIRPRCSDLRRCHE
jgi:hypothetical protein